MLIRHRIIFNRVYNKEITAKIMLKIKQIPQKKGRHVIVPTFFYRYVDLRYSYLTSISST